MNSDSIHRRLPASPPQPIFSLPPQASGSGVLLPPRATAAGTLRRLQLAALVGFCERGYHGVSTRDLAAATGVRVSSVYAHVNAKEDILLELMVIGHQEHNEGLRMALLAAPPDPVQQLRALVTSHVEMHATYPLLCRVANKELHALSPANADRVMAVRFDSERMFLDVVNRGVDAGVFRCEDPWLAVAAIGGMGIRVAEWFDAKGPRTVAQVADFYSDFAIKMVS